MSAELLRRAAALMRERAEAATSGPWDAVALGSEGYAVLAYHPANEFRRSRVRVARHTWEDWNVDKANAEHIASWHPAVVLTVADWLTVTAWWLEDEWPDDPDAPMDRMNSTGETAERVKAALAVARAYLGEES